MFQILVFKPNILLLLLLEMWVDYNHTAITSSLHRYVRLAYTQTVCRRTKSQKQSCPEIQDSKNANIR